MGPRSVIIFCCVALAGCSYSPSDAFINWVCPGGMPRIDLELNKATDDWVFNPHGFVYSNVVDYYHFVIPSIPATRQTYGFQEVSLETFHSRTKNIGALSSGNIVIDPRIKEIVVSLSTATGDFPGNGTYKLSPHDLPTSGSPLTHVDLQPRCRKSGPGD